MSSKFKAIFFGNFEVSQCHLGRKKNRFWQIGITFYSEQAHMVLASYSELGITLSLQPAEEIKC